MTPRLLIAGTDSGCGKTTFTCGILQALVNRGLRPMACKSGPDYIDPMFHSRIIGAESRNLDLFFYGPDTTRYLLSHHGAGRDVVVLEGAMGYYDGVALTSDASAWALACETQTPAVLVVDGRGGAVSLCATILGFLQFQPESQIRGVLLNRIPPGLYPRLKEVIEERCGVPVYGYLPSLPQCAIESRHLGLLTADEVEGLREKMTLLAAQVEQTINLNGLLALADTAPALNPTSPALPEPVRGRPVIAVARDEAFCFVYQDNLELLEQLGAKLSYFSPLRDEKLPPCQGLYLPGGYPELYAARLSGQPRLRAEICRAVAGGLPTVAECGGFLYLQQELEDSEGNRWPMCGVLPGRGFRTPRLQRFGYVTLTAGWDNLLCGAGETLRAHEFHYWDSDAPGDAFRAQKPRSRRGWDCAVATETLYAGFPHLAFYANPNAAARFLSKAAAYQRKET
ncbi:MAG: cobyrinate a,c-diamide synthase [Oscillospiraceae bacterium]|nr:cobyrinate a,c-diamide synthase [Oscillospiraceae bacterium]